MRIGSDNVQRQRLKQTGATLRDQKQQLSRDSWAMSNVPDETRCRIHRPDGHHQLVEATLNNRDRD